jgi:hypothetical protein
VALNAPGISTQAKSNTNFYVSGPSEPWRSARRFIIAKKTGTWISASMFEVHGEADFGTHRDVASSVTILTFWD